MGGTWDDTTSLAKELIGAHSGASQIRCAHLSYHWRILVCRTDERVRDWPKSEALETSHVEFFLLILKRVLQVQVHVGANFQRSHDLPSD